ncbi:EamA family transporter [Pseudomonas promysalinigenes]|uniref:EamA family transporter n=1 Tax=Pseudomonas promysalinigenes TaxID=485898 RepID=UPI0016454BAC|nr:EamA family transporter [Pseudomonas promysalinigenes]QXI32221.1 EamA family transporter [Pseudomonas promysalinigenes]
MTWLYFALLAPLFWSLSNIVDKFAINHITSNCISFIFLLSIGNIFFAGAIYAYFQPTDLDLHIAVINICSGLAIFLQYFAYSYSLEDMDVSVVIPIHQSEPIFVLAASILIFHAIPTSWQVAGFAMIVVGILILCMSRQTIRGLGHPRHVVVLLVSAFFGAVSTVISDEILQLKSLESVLIFNFAGYSLGGMLLLLVPKWRRLITNDLKTLNLKQFGIFGVTNIFDVGGYVFFTAALAAGGGAALVSVVVSIHPLFVLALGFLATKLFPKFIAEDIAPGGVVRKFLSIVIIVVGVAVISHQAM